MPVRRLYAVLVLFFVAALCLMVSEARAGAWVQSRHGYYFKLSANYLFTTREFNHEGERLDIFQERLVYKNSSFQDFNITAYLEYGLFERLTLVANVPFKVLRSKRTEIVGAGLLARIVTNYTLGFSDLAVSGRYALVDGALALSVQGGIKAPLGYDKAPADDGPPLGTGKIDLEGHLLIGKSLYPLPAYITASVGYRRRTGPLADQVLFTGEVGYAVGNFLFKIGYDGLKSTVAPPDIVGQPVTTPLPGGGGALPNIIVGDQDIFKISPSVIYNATDAFALQAELLHIYAGKNTVAGTIYSFGLVLKK